MRDEEIKAELQEIKSQITALAHQHLKPNLPMDVREVITKMEPWANVEKAIDDLIIHVKLPF